MSKIFIALSVLCLIVACNRTEVTIMPGQAPFLNVDSDWADSMMLEFTLEEKIGQLFVLHPKEVLDQKDSIIQWGAVGKLGGVLLENLDLEDYATLIDTLQQIARIPILNGTRESIVLNNQFTDITRFPLGATLSAIQKDSIYDQLRKLYIQQCKALNIHFALAPIIDQNEIGDSLYNFDYAENDSIKTIQRALKTLDEFDENKLLSVAQSFDELTFLENDTLHILDSLLLKFRLLTRQGLTGMLASVDIFKEQEVDKMQSDYLQKYLSRQVGFDGLIFGEVREGVELEDLLHAGTDVFIVEKDLNAHIDTLKSMLAQGLLSEKELNHKVYKVLMSKSWVGLDRICETIYPPLARQLMEPEHLDYYVHSLFEKSIILANNPNNLIPFIENYKKDFRLVQIGKQHLRTFRNHFSKYAAYTPYLYPPSKEGDIAPLNKKKFKRSRVVLTLDNQDLQKEKHTDFINSVNEISNQTNVVLVNFGNPLNLQYFDTTLTVVQVFEKNKTTSALVPQLLFGGMQAQGKLPLDIASHLRYQQQALTPVTRLKYTVPQDVGIAPHKLVGIDAIINNAVSSGATPGGQVTLVKDGKVFYQKSFGYHSYNKRQKVKDSDLYDVASLTKIAATTLAVMKLYDESKLKLNDKVKKYMECGENSTIKNISIKKLLIHQSRLQSNMPIAPYILFKDTTDADCNKYFCNHPYGDFTVQISDSLYMDRRWVDSIWATVDELPLRRYRRYKYSDVNFNILKRIVEQRVGEELDDYLNRTFYYPLNTRHCTYQPLEEFRSDQIVPTAFDEKWRKTLLDGYVHDESAALLGGVGGNAGLFSNANDLALIFQMLLNGGTYGGKKYLSPSTIDVFTSNKHGNHRALGFDRNSKRRIRTCSSKASSLTYGHTGFTGTCAWIDPKEKVIFIFLANRINPDVKNKRIFRHNTRARIHSLIYSALDTYEDKLFARSKKSIVKLAKRKE